MSTSDDCNEYICSNAKDENQLKQLFSNPSRSWSSTTPDPSTHEGPLNAIHLGRSTWPLLHKFTLNYPQNPSEHHKLSALQLIKSFSKIYPCKTCRVDFQGEIVKSPPRVESREELAMWMCEQHNVVNRKMGKSEFKCSVRRLELLYGRRSEIL